MAADRPPNSQPSLDREGIAAGDGWDDEWMICICDSAVSVGLYQSSPPPLRGAPPFKGGFSFSPLRGQPVLWQLATLMGNGEMIDSSNRFCPLTAIAELSRGRALAYRFPHLARVWFISQPHRCLVTKMNQPGRSAATLPALGRVGPCIMLSFFLICALQG